MFVRSLLRYAATSAASSSAARERVPDVMLSFGTRANRITFVSHPGVMAVAKLLEMRYLTRPRADLTQENVDAIKEFDEELAEKCQIALDNNLHVNFMEMEHLDKPVYVEKLKKEKQILDMARAEVLQAPVGHYEIPSVLNSNEGYEVPRSWRPELVIGEEILEVQPGMRESMQLQEIVNKHINNKYFNKVGDGSKSQAIGKGVKGEKEKLLPSSSKSDTATTKLPSGKL